MALTGCAPADPTVDFEIDLRRSTEGVAAVAMRLRSPGPGPLTLSSFAQPEAARVGSVRARASGESIPVVERADVDGFRAWSLDPPAGAGEITIEYEARPGAVEMARMAGPTGFRLGILDGDFGLFGARQIFLLPTTPRLPASITATFIAPADREILTTWPMPRDTNACSFTGPDVAHRFLDAVIAVGRFETRVSADGRFEVAVPAFLPETTRADATRRALALEEHLTSALGPPPQPYRLILVPKPADGFSVPAMESPAGLGLSLGPGVPTRWLTIGRAMGRSRVEARIEALPASDPGRRVLEALPTWLTVQFSERDGWRSRRDWFEQFYSETVDLDLGDPGLDVESTRLEWRTSVALELLSRALLRRGRASLETLVADTLGRGRRLEWSRFVERDLPADLRTQLDRWLSPDPNPFPLPGEEDTPPRATLRSPPVLRGAGASSGRVDFYIAARNFGLLEQCGCKKEQLGGMARRATVLRSRLAGGGAAMAFELGDAIPWDSNAPMLDAQKTADSDLVLALLAEAGTRATVVGHAELSYGPEFLAERLARLPAGLAMLSANVSGPNLAPAPLLDVTWTRPRVAIAGLMAPTSYDLGRALEFEDATADLVIAEPAAAAAAVLKDRLGTELTVVAGPLGPRQVLEIHAAVPGVDVIVTSNYFRFLRLPLLRFERPVEMATFGMLDDTLVVLLKSDAKGFVHLAVGVGPDGHVAAADLEAIPLNEAIREDARVRRRLDEHYAHLAAASGMPDRPPMGDLLHGRLQAEYVGQEKCADCHREETRQWLETSHATAFITLLGRHRQGVPSCFACHVTGYRQPGGYRGMSDVGLRHVQCEACHGPGSRHVEDAAAASIVKAPPAAVCRECHTPEHSDMTDGNLDDYRTRVAHGGARIVHGAAVPGD